MGDKIALGCHHTQATKDLMSRQRKGQHRSPATEFKKGENNSPATEFKKGQQPHNVKNLQEDDLRDLRLERMLTLKQMEDILGCSVPTIRRYIDIYDLPVIDTKFKKGNEPWNKGKKGCWNDEMLRRILTCRVPNNEERFLVTVFEKYSFPYKFVGDGQVIIGGRNPDFINTNGQKKIIEFFGEYWHPPEDENEKREIYKQFGFDLLVIWGKDLKDEKALLDKVIKFEDKKARVTDKMKTN